MWFKNLQIYRLPAPWFMTASQLGELLAPHAFTPASSNELLRQGFASPRGNDQLVHAVNGQLFIVLRTEKKLLPAAVINAVAKAKAAELEEQQGFPLGRKAMRELKERTADELLPRAFSVPADTWAWIDTKNGWLVVDAASPTRADDVIKHLLKAVDRMPLESLRVARSPIGVMTGWLEANYCPPDFTIDRDTELQAAGESQAAVRYVKHTLEPDDIRRHIAAGKQCTRLALTWNDRVSFVLTESLAIKAVKALDVIKEGTAVTHNDEERFDNDLALMTGELAALLAALVLALGGEADDLAGQAQQAAGERASVAVRTRQLHQIVAEHGRRGVQALGLTAELIEKRERMREILGDTYAAQVQAVTPRLQAQMAAHDQNAIEAALALAKEVTATAGQVLLCAAMDLIEEKNNERPALSLDLGPDDLQEQAKAIVLQHQRASISLIQRHLGIGYNRAARLIEGLEQAGVVSAMQPNGQRAVLAS